VRAGGGRKGRDTVPVAPIRISPYNTSRNLPPFARYPAGGRCDDPSKRCRRRPLSPPLLSGPASAQRRSSTRSPAAGPTGLPGTSISALATGVMADPSGDVYVALVDFSYSGRIFKVAPGGVATLVAGAA